MDFAARAEPVARPYIVYGGAVVSLTGHTAGALRIGYGLVADPDPAPPRR